MGDRSVSHLTLLPEHLAGRSTPSSSQPPRFNASSLISNVAIDSSTTVCRNLKFSAWRNERRLIGRSCVFGTSTAFNANLLMITKPLISCVMAFPVPDCAKEERQTTEMNAWENATHTHRGHRSIGGHAGERPGSARRS